MLVCSYQLMCSCWKDTKEQRPTFTQLRLQLKAQSITLKRKILTENKPDHQQ